MLDQQTKKRIDDCRDILVGKITDPKSQVEQITIALIYKFMDDMDIQSVEMGGVPTYFINNYKKYSWTNIFSPRIGGEEMLTLYAEGMTQMGQNPHLPQLFRDIFKNAYLPYRDPETLRLFLRTINEFQYDHSERLGDAFEYLLSVLGSQGDAGQFRTPRHIIDFIVRIISPQKSETILDPSAGTCGFLISAFKYIIESNTNKRPGDKLTPDERKKLMNQVTGYDISPDMVRLSLVNLFLHGFANPKVFEYDTLTSEDRWNEYFDVILANPPFMTPKGGIRPHRRFGISSNRAEVLFVDYIMEHLTPKGRAGIVVPEGIIFQSGTAYKTLRRLMVEKYLVGVISLPKGVFNPYSPVQTSILVLDRYLNQKTAKIFFAKVENDGYDLGAQRRPINKNDLPLVTESITKYLDGLRNGKSDEVEGISFVSKQQILGSNDYSLNYDRYVEKEIHVSTHPSFELKELVVFKRGTSITKKDVLPGNVPVIAGGQNPAYFHNEFNRNGETITISSSGAYSGFVNYFTTPIFASDCFTIKPKDSNLLNTKFLYHLLKFKQNDIYLKQVGGAQPHIYPKSFDGFEIPLPPIEVQEEIVRELEHYQKIIDGAKQVVDNYKPIIEIDPSWEMRELGEVYNENLDNKRKPVTKSVRTNGIYPYYGASGIVDYVEDFIFNEPLLLISEDGANLITRNTPIAFSVDGKIWVNNHAHILKFDNYTTQKYVEGYINQIDISNFVTGSAQPKLNQQNMNIIPIPLPPIQIQESIVEQIESERHIVEGNKKLIEIYTQKIQDRINKIWGD